MTVDTTADIHPTAIIEDGATIGAGCKIGPYCIVGADVTLGQKVDLKSHVVVQGWTDIGDETIAFPFASIGSAPQDLKYAGERTKLEIGKRNRIRESASLSPGTAGGGGLTKIGDNNLMMVNTHVGHDCIMGHNNIMANGVGLAGHVVAGDNIVMGANSGVHQFCRLGSGSMLAAYAAVVEDVIPNGMVSGNRAKLDALNLIGLKRRNYSKTEINAFRAAYKDVFHKDEGLLRDRALAALETYPDSTLVAEMVTFMTSDTNRQICTASKG